ncbi:hypothetical protein GGX14DRAFT_399652 [Mycena pura]|uniref:Uncharacterized protein n=1 Tax=Mycena pura TaxID=153505 RepID=A0AAD6Y6M3_9AGAR|nr:hypothetical protein GGX14DRAFT_399652 [Mycena pura]
MNRPRWLRISNLNGVFKIAIQTSSKMNFVWGFLECGVHAVEMVYPYPFNHFGCSGVNRMSVNEQYSGVAGFTVYPPFGISPKHKFTCIPSFQTQSITNHLTLSTGLSIDRLAFIDRQSLVYAVAQFLIALFPNLSSICDDLPEEEDTPEHCQYTPSRWNAVEELLPNRKR